MFKVLKKQLGELGLIEGIILLLISIIGFVVFIKSSTISIQSVGFVVYLGFGTVSILVITSNILRRDQ
ncbi:MAG: hypothetical protein PHT54_01060 [Candidatus Nanoarchaeia archaeon]|nr:hypothetical protein [Candidatus Nanoarchaeia archaeon]